MQAVADPAVGEMPLIRIVDAIIGGMSVLVTGPGEMAPLLNQAAQQMGRTRVIRIRPPFGLPNFIGQVAAPGTDPGIGEKTDHDETEVERAFCALTELGCRLRPHRTYWSCSLLIGVM